MTLADDELHDNTGYNPYAGRTIRGWPEIVLRRGAVVVEDRVLQASAGSGRLILRKAGPAITPTGTLSGLNSDPTRILVQALLSKPRAAELVRSSLVRYDICASTRTHPKQL